MRISRSSFNDLFDAYFVRKGLRTKHLLCKILEIINHCFLFIKVERIRVYSLKGDNLWLVSSTKFLWERKLTLSESGLTIYRSHDGIIKNNIFYKNTAKNQLWYIHLLEDQSYLFCCDCDKLYRIQLLGFFYKKRLSKMFNKTSLIILSDYRLMTKRQQFFNEIKDNVVFVNKAIDTMHFIRNRLSPLSNMIEILKKEEKNEIPFEQKGAIRKALYKDNAQADRNVKEILTMANFLLDKNNNPYDERDMEEIKVSQLYIILSEVVQDILDDTIAAGSTLREISNNQNNVTVKTNLKEYKILVTDWIKNISKYKLKYFEGMIEVAQSRAIITLKNDFPPSDIEIVRSLVNDMNSMTKEAVLRDRKYGHGLAIIKSIAQLMDYKLEVVIQQEENHGNIIVFNLMINCYE